MLLPINAIKKELGQLLPVSETGDIGGVLVAGTGPSTITSIVMNLILNLIHQKDIKGPMSQSLVTLARHAKGFSDI